MNLFWKTSLFFIFFSLMIFSTSAFATPIDEKMIEQNEILQSIQIQQAELDSLSNQYTEALLNQEELENQIAATTSDIETLNNEIKEDQKQLGEQCNYIYKNGNISFLEVILNSTDYNSFLTNLDYYNRLMNQTDMLISETEELKAEADNKKAIQEQEKKDLEETISQLEEAQENANNIILNLQEQYSQLDEETASLVVEQQSILVQDNYEIEDAANILINNTTQVSENDFQNMIAEIQAQDAAAGVTSDYSDVVARAESMLGAPYVWGGTTSAGFDCSGFVSYCLTGEEGVRLGTTETFSNWTQVSDPQPGDVCVIHNGESQHTGVYVGNGNMIHAATYGVGVVESPVQDGMVYVRYE